MRPPYMTSSVSDRPMSSSRSAETTGAAHLRAHASGIAAVDLDAAGGEGLGAEQGPDELALAVAFHAGDAEDLARVHAERDVVDDGAAVEIDDVEVVDRQRHAI